MVMLTCIFLVYLNYELLWIELATFSLCWSALYVAIIYQYFINSSGSRYDRLCLEKSVKKMYATKLDIGDPICYSFDVLIYFVICGISYPNDVRKWHYSFHGNQSFCVRLLCLNRNRSVYPSVNCCTMYSYKSLIKNDLYESVYLCQNVQAVCYFGQLIFHLALGPTCLK